MFLSYKCHFIPIRIAFWLNVLKNENFNPSIVCVSTLVIAFVWEGISDMFCSYWKWTGSFNVFLQQQGKKMNIATT